MELFFFAGIAMLDNVDRFFIPDNITVKKGNPSYAKRAKNNSKKSLFLLEAVSNPYSHLAVRTL